MKDSESIDRSNKKTNGRAGTKLLANGSPITPTKNNGTTSSPKSDQKKRVKKSKTVMGASGSTSKRSGGQQAGSAVSSNRSGGSSGRKSSKQSPELRPRRRASQTYFFKYQLAKNPLKQEEEDLRLALLASLQQCSADGSDNDTNNNNELCSSTLEKLIARDRKTKHTGSKQSIHQNKSEPRKRPVGRPPKNTDAIINLENGTHEKKSTSSPATKKKRSIGIEENLEDGNKRRGSVESSSSSRGSSSKEEKNKKKKSKHARHRASLLAANAIDGELDSTKHRSKVKSSLMNKDLASVQNKIIKKAKKLLQNKQANKDRNNGIISKYSALRKFPSNSNSTSAKRQSRSLLSPTKNATRKSKANNCYMNNFYPASNHNSQSYYTYSPYTPLQKKEPPDEDYLKKYKPETEDFLTFICFRSTAPNYPNIGSPINGEDDSSSCPSPNKTSNNIISNRTPDKNVSDMQNLKNFSTSPSQRWKLSSFNGNNGNNYSDPLVLANFRRPVRQSPRLASSNRKISENDNSNHSLGTSNTAYENSITYEEDMKRASMALEDMAQEINSSDDIHNEVAQNQQNCISKSSSPYKCNKHLVKGLMTREFAGAFADEDTIFESISNHKL